ncbi:hypothetical protein [Maritimibacter sp. UBA3975]|uniref:hypothetical protein n=1 Tax=Maritimibacter sp. UBA3975 TaxID=1946833 RepID=UPI000C095437|nr:hypothetical protein [Maritimibacter sp. UBA3975]MAM61892.1 hypothetical protein [Maritimibacter sp.]|tara:strand:+ start:12903 stop:13364 length:462 start_codon:yes stop_codon:yes gene_type:complete
MIRLALAALCLTVAPAAAQVAVGDCDWRASAQSVAEPWEANSRTFANGDVRLAKLDVGEPAFGGFFLLVLSPPRDEIGFRQCRVITFPETSGFGGMDFDALEAGYDPSVGLMFTVPVKVFVASDAVEGQPALLRFSLNQATGAISPRLTLTRD